MQMLAHWVNKQTCTVALQTETLGTFDHKQQLEQSNMHYLSQYYSCSSLFCLFIDRAVLRLSILKCLQVTCLLKFFKFKIKLYVLSFFSLRKMVEMYPRSLSETGAIAPFLSKFSISCLKYVNLFHVFEVFFEQEEFELYLQTLTVLSTHLS